MATQIYMRKKRCAEEESKNNKMKKIIKQQCSSSTSMIHGCRQQNKSSSWSDLDWDMLREINNKLPCNYADAIAFRGVCKSWRAAGRLKTAGDVLLPWFISIGVDRHNKILSYDMYDPQFLWEEEENQDPTIIKSDDDKSSTSTGSTSSAAAIKISGTINLNDYFLKQTILRPIILRYVDGWLHVSFFTFQGRISYFLFFSLETKTSFTLPQLNDSSNHLFLGLSTTIPDSPDCVFLTMWLNHDYTIKIGIFRHGDTHWTIITQSVRPCFDISRDMAAVFISGVFYFVDRAGLGSYDLATGALKLDRFSTVLEFSNIHNFFWLDGDLMLAYSERTNLDFCIRKYDWMNKLWVRPQTLGGRSLYLTGNSVYVDHINYIGPSSANKIYVRVLSHIYLVDEYTLVSGYLSKCPSARRLVRWPGLSCKTGAMWVSPPHVLLRK